MKREIKFRQRILKEDGSFKSFHYWGFINGEFIAPAFQFGHDSTAEKSDEFTGLKDKNGKEIYEGGIVHGCFWIGEREVFTVIMSDGCFCAKWPNKQEDVSEYLHVITDLEVIGNIYENPELLSQ